MDECGPKPNAVLQRPKYLQWKLCKAGSKEDPSLGMRNKKENAFVPSYDKKRS